MVTETDNNNDNNFYMRYILGEATYDDRHIYPWYIYIQAYKRANLQTISGKYTFKVFFESLMCLGMN